VGPFVFDASLWLADADAAWVFVTVPEDISDEIEDAVWATGGFGSGRVEASIGTTTWSTSLFPDTKAGAFILPVKKSVRSAERVDVGDTVNVTLEIAVPDP